MKHCLYNENDIQRQSSNERSIYIGQIAQSKLCVSTFRHLEKLIRCAECAISEPRVDTECLGQILQKLYFSVSAGGHFEFMQITKIAQSCTLGNQAKFVLEPRWKMNLKKQTS